MTLHVLIAQRTTPRVALALALAPAAIAVLSICARSRRYWIIPIAAILFGLVLWRFGDALAAGVDNVLYAENIAFDLLLALVFAITLLPGREALVTRLARVVHGGAIPDVIVPYTRAVTAMWAIYFIALASISTLLFFTQSREAWSLFVNVLVWPLTVAVFAIEYTVRLRVLRDVDHISLWATMRAFRHRAP
ncbi:MAG: hypothetical protein ACR2GP_11195 [Burkholderiaceae bacterium]